MVLCPELQRAAPLLDAVEPERGGEVEEEQLSGCHSTTSVTDMRETLDLVRPRYGTERSDRPTRGDRVEAASLLISRTSFLPWQRHVSDIANEIDPETGLLYYETVVIVVPRQQGKTTLLEPTLVDRALRRPDIDVVYTAQDRQMSKRRLIDELADKRLARRPELAGSFKVRRSNGSESIRWSNGSQITTVANTDEAGHGLTLDLACLDEAFSHDDLTVVTALEPTTITRPDPQVWVVSTVGDGSDGLLQHYQELGERSLSDPASRIAYFEWSATDDDDRDDPETWARCMPALGFTIDPDRIRGRRASLTPEVFDRAYLCRRPSVEMSARFPTGSWDACARSTETPLDLDPTSLVVAFDVAADRESTSIAVAGYSTTSRRLGVVTHSIPSVSVAAVDEISQLVGRLGPRRILADRRAGAGALIDALAIRGVPIEEVSSSMLVTHCGSLYDAVVAQEVEHDAQPALDAAARAAVSRPLGDSWAWDRRRSPVELSPLVAATNAVGGHRATFGDSTALGIY